MVQFGLIADDFTGAGDVGIQFRKRGLKTIVLTHTESLGKIENFDVTVIDTESRNDLPDVAYDKVRNAVKALKKKGARLLYKKIDSTLRGNIGAELDAAMNELDVKAAIVAPAFPATNRTTVNGRQLVNGVPLEITEFSQDPICPVKESYIPALIKQQTRRKIGVIDLSKVREGPESLKRKIQNLIRSRYEILVADAKTVEDLRAIAKAALDSNIFPCGSAGLAKGVSHWLTSFKAKKVLLLVSGSVNSVTLNQILAAEKVLEIEVLEPELSRVLMDRKERKAEADRLVEEAKRAIAKGMDVIVRLAESKEEVFRIQRLANELGIDNVETAEKMLLFLGEISREIIDTCKIEGLTLVGGDTAIKVMNAIGAYGIRVEQEILPGIPLGRLLGGRFDGLPVVTKAGGFGREDALIKAIGRLEEKVWIQS